MDKSELISLLKSHLKISIDSFDSPCAKGCTQLTIRVTWQDGEEVIDITRVSEEICVSLPEVY